MSVESFKCEYMKDGMEFDRPTVFFVKCEYHNKPDGVILSILREMNDFCSKCEVFLKDAQPISEVETK